MQTHAWFRLIDCLRWCERFLRFKFCIKALFWRKSLRPASIHRILFRSVSYGKRVFLKELFKFWRRKKRRFSLKISNEDSASKTLSESGLFAILNCELWSLHTQPFTLICIQACLNLQQVWNLIIELVGLLCESLGKRVIRTSLLCSIVQSSSRLSPAYLQTLFEVQRVYSIHCIVTNFERIKDRANREVPVDEADVRWERTIVNHNLWVMNARPAALLHIVLAGARTGDLLVTDHIVESRNRRSNQTVPNARSPAKAR